MRIPSEVQNWMQEQAALSPEGASFAMQVDCFRRTPPVARALPMPRSDGEHIIGKIQVSSCMRQTYQYACDAGTPSPPEEIERGCRDFVQDSNSFRVFLTVTASPENSDPAGKKWTIAAAGETPFLTQEERERIRRQVQEASLEQAFGELSIREAPEEIKNPHYHRNPFE